MRILLSVLTIFLVATLAFSQATTGKIIGTVLAPDGALIPGATIVARDNQTGKEKTITATDDGTFEISQLEFGTYTVTITASGYKTFTASNVKIDANREYPLKAQMEVGQITESVTVTAGAEAVNASNGELSTTVDKQQIQDLPLNGRNPLNLAYLQAGSSVTTNSINGQRASSTTITRDGLNVQDKFIRTGSLGSSAFSDSPSVDDVSEFTLTTQNAGVEQGGGSSQIQLVTPRGGSQFHGSLYAFNRNSQFTANTFFNNATPDAQGKPIAKPFLNRNQFGGSISGPMPIFNFGEGGPSFLKNKAFFFFNYEAFRLAQQVSITNASDDFGTLKNFVTLLPASRNGNFTFINSSGQLTTVNVLTGQNFSDPNLASQGGILSVDPVIQSRFLDGLPTTGNGVLTGIGFLQNVRLNRSSPQIRNAGTGRIDINFNDRNSVSGVYKLSSSRSGRTDVPAGFSPDPFVFSNNKTHFLSAAYRWVPTNSFSNEFRTGFQLSKIPFIGSNVPSDYLISTGTFNVTAPFGTYLDNGRNTDYYNFQDNAVYTTGNHSFRFGGQAETIKVQIFDTRGTTPTYTISDTANPNTPPLLAQQICGTNNCINSTDLARANQLRYFLGGIIGSVSRTANLKSVDEGYTFGQSDQTLDYEIYSAYFSDQWRLKPNFTLNLGLRYEFYSPLNSKQKLYLEPEVVNGDVVGSILNPNGKFVVVGTNSGTPGAFTKPDKDNFAPSVSFAYSPRAESGFLAKVLSNTFVLRGGARVNYVNDEYVKAISTGLQTNGGLGSVTTGVNNLAAALTPRNGFTAVPSVNTLPSFTAPNLTFAQRNASIGFASITYGSDPKLQVPRTFEYNLGIQREIGFKTVMEVRYVGGFSNDWVTSLDYNQLQLRQSGFLDDFFRAQGNLTANDAERAKRIAACVAAGGGATVTSCTNTLNAATIVSNGQTIANPAFFPRSIGFTGAPGTVNLTVIGQLPSGGLPTNATIIGQVETGRPGALAQTYVTNRSIFGSNLPFIRNPNLFVTRILSNTGRYRYNALQAELRRRFNNGLYFQVNYTFSKTLTDIPADSQNRSEDLQDIDNPQLSFSRPDYDRTHVLNANFIYELPFGKGKMFLNRGGWVDKVFGGFQFGSIISANSGPPLAIIDPRGTANLTFQSGRQSGTSSLTGEEIKALTGVFKTANGLYFIDPRVLNATITNTTTGEVRQGFDLYQPLPAGFTLTSVRAASAVGTAPFPGQVFFFNQAGSTGNLGRNFLNGLPYINWDASLIKNIRITETSKLQIRIEAFNVLNRQLPAFSADLDVNSNNFGLIQQTNTTTNPSGPRIIQFGIRYDF